MLQDTKAVIYTRVSTGGQAENGTSLDSQLTACCAKAEQMGAQVVSTYRETESGSYYLRRPELNKALQDLETGKANLLVIFDLSRYSRDGEHQKSILKRVRRANAKLVFCNQTFEDSPEGELAFGMSGEFSEYERKLIRRRTMHGKRRRAEEGKMPVRTFAPFGYHLVTKRDVIARDFAAGREGTYEVIPEQARWVREIFHRYSTGQTLRSITRFLYDHGISTSTGNREWHHTTLTSMMRNPVYKGTAAFGRHRSVMAENEHTVQRHTDPSEWIYVPAPPLVSDEVWEACQKALAENQSRYSGNSERKRMLTGLVRCPACGGKMVSHTQRENRRWKSHGGTKEKQRVRFFYRCPQWALIEPACELSRRSYNGVPFEASVVAQVRAIVQDPRLIEQAFLAYQQAVQSKFSEDEYQQLQRELAEINRQELDTAKAQVRGIAAGADSNVYERLLSELAEERNKLRERLAEMESQRQEAQSTLPRERAAAIHEVLDAAEQVLLMPQITPVEKHALLARVIDSIYPAEEGAKIRFKDAPKPV